MATTTTESSRVFVSGLPSSLTSEQLASHFRTQYKVTDAHVLPDRRIGFVGFDDSNTAKNAVQYFNRSFIRMSKISVDLARPVEVKHDTDGQAVPVSGHGARKRKDWEQTTSEQEVIDSRKRKRNTRDDGEREREVAQAPGLVHTTPSVPQVQTEGGPENVKATMSLAEQEHGQRPEAASDGDWLRGKTSRLLDLVEPGDVTVPEEAVVQTEQAVQPEELVEDSHDGEDANTQAEQQKGQSVPNGRLFIRNLAFDVAEDDLRRKFAAYGKIQELHILKNTRTSTSKGMAFVQFSDGTAAADALTHMDGAAFHGRLLHILPASDKREQGLTDFDISKMPLKKQKAVRRKLDAATATFSWNSLYMNPDAVVSSIANRLGVSKADIIDPTSADAAVKQAHAETQVIAETKDYFRSRGASVDAFKNKARDDRTILLKNFPYGTADGELKGLLEPYGQLTRFLMPPAGTMAVAQFAEPYSALSALKGLAYKNIQGSVLYLEKAPQGLLADGAVPNITDQDVARVVTSEPKTTSDVQPQLQATVFVRNLSFDTTTSRLREVFSPLSGFSSARVKTRTDPKRPGEILSNGFGFIEFTTIEDANAAITAMSGYRLDGHNLVLKISSKQNDVAEERRKADMIKKNDANKTKIIIKNLPFQASRKDIKTLFAQYGQLKTVRVPKKFDNTSRGFGFAEFVTTKEAQNAMDALANTHLLGRRLVLDFVSEETVDAEEEIKAIEKKIEQQSNRMNLSKLTGAGRRKFTVGGEEEDLA